MSESISVFILHTDKFVQNIEFDIGCVLKSHSYCRLVVRIEIKFACWALGFQFYWWRLSKNHGQVFFICVNQISIKIVYIYLLSFTTLHHNSPWGFLRRICIQLFDWGIPWKLVDDWMSYELIKASDIMFSDLSNLAKPVKWDGKCTCLLPKRIITTLMISWFQTSNVSLHIILVNS